MDVLINCLETVLQEVTELAIVFFETVGVVVIIISGVQGVVNYIRRNPRTVLLLAQGFATGLEFKLGSEILRTVVVREWTEILTVAGIIALRAALTFLIHWEIKEEREENREPAGKE
ncbi:MAG: DUF1622 domain-containing protein [Clostridiales bacterium]|nr:DUF1622 domain-containing protein [Clostridiales bacterium]MCD7830322.1 DUF1622 domain-containing protein [Clostridiales bacterium]